MAQNIISKTSQIDVKICGAESCTGGLISALLTSVPGSSSALEFNMVTYSNDSKERILGVSKEILTKNGAVSPECAAAMAEGAFDICLHEKKIAFAVTGIAGPGGGNEQKPVGLVYICIKTSKNNSIIVIEKRFSGSRNEIRDATVEATFNLMMQILS